MSPLPLGVLASAHVPAAGDWTPADLSSLRAWYDASALTGLADNDAVTSWPDQSGNGWTLTTDPSGGAATYKTGVRAGKPVVRFDGTNDMLSAFGALDGVSNYQITAVLSVTSGSAIRVPVANQKNAAPRIGGALILDASNVRGIYSPATYATYAGGTYTTGTWERWSLSSTAVLYVNDVSVQTSASLGVGGDLIIGSSVRTSSSRFIEFPTPMDVADVVVTSAILSTSDRAALDAYLSDKWGF